MLTIHRTSLRVRASRLRLAKSVANVPLGERPRRPAETISVGNARSIVVRLGAHTRCVAVASVATGRQIRPAKSPIGRSSCGSIGSIGIGYPRLTRVRSRPDQPFKFCLMQVASTRRFAAVVWTSRRSSSLGDEYEKLWREHTTVVRQRSREVKRRVKVLQVVN